MTLSAHHAWLALLPVLALFGCNRSTASGDEGGHYSGIGIYEADKLWKHVEGAPAVGAAQAALGDDTQIIVVVDRQSGEVRQCGNHSGFCIAMNPWQGAAPRLPARLDAHADDVEAAANSASNAAE